MRTFEDDGLLREVPFLAAACLVHGLLLTAMPSLNWGGSMPKPAPMPVEFVTSLPKLPEPTPALAPLPQAAGPANERPAAAGPAQGGNDAPKAAKKVVHRPKLSAAQRARIALHRAEARQRAKVVAAARAEAARVRAEAAREARIAHEQKVAAERLAKQQRVAAARAERAAQRAEISQQLATMVDPDENLTDAPNDPSLGPVLGGGAEPASLGSAKEAVYDVERDGFEPAPGKGSGGGGGGLSWSIEGPIGNRRIMRRPLPTCPAWVGQRGLELAVQIKFQVLPDGSVKAGAVISKTSGFPEIDKRALDAIRQWRFEAIAPRPGMPEIWGKVRFKFLMG